MATPQKQDEIIVSLHNTVGNQQSVGEMMVLFEGGVQHEYIITAVVFNDEKTTYFLRPL